MPFRVPLRRKRGVYFSKMAAPASDSASAASSNRISQSSRIVELQDDDANDANMATPPQEDALPPIPSLFTSLLIHPSILWSGHG